MILGHCQDMSKTTDEFLKKFDSYFGGDVGIKIPEIILQDAYKMSHSRRHIIPDNFTE
jgi:hypothetical protein